MENMATVIILRTVVTVLAEITDKIKIPYPILLVLAGIGIGLFPGLPRITVRSAHDEPDGTAEEWRL